MTPRWCATLALLVLSLIESSARGAPTATDAPARKPSDTPNETATTKARDEHHLSLKDALSKARRSRCATAICWGKDGDNEYGIEPLIEMPIGKTFTVAGRGQVLGNFIDSRDFAVNFSGGIRFWFLHDWASLSVYFSTPVADSKTTLHVRGSTQDYPTSAIRRPYPGFAIGLLGDVLWIGFDYQELRNSGSPSDPNYSRDSVVSRACSMTVALATGTAIRNGLGTALAHDSQPNSDASTSASEPAADGSTSKRSTEATSTAKTLPDRNAGRNGEPASATSGKAPQPNAPAPQVPPEKPADDSQEGGE